MKEVKKSKLEALRAKLSDSALNEDRTLTIKAGAAMLQGTWPPISTGGG